MKFPSLVLVASGLILASISGCSRSEPSDPARMQSPQGPVISAGDIKDGDAEVVLLSNGAEIVIKNLGGENFFQVEATFSDQAFSRMLSESSWFRARERQAFLNRELDKVFGKLKTVRAIELSRVPDIGYFKFMIPYRPDLMAPLRALRLEGLSMNPVVHDRQAFENVKAIKPSEEGLVRVADARGDTRDFSGLHRIHEPEFVKLAEAAIGDGTKVDGSSVNLGITDTGITFDHPTFLSADETRNRITYMRDYTREGRVYFHPQAKFEISVPENGGDEDLLVNAQVIATPPLPNLPAGDALSEVKDLRIKVSFLLRSILMKPGSGAKLGVLLEESLQNFSTGELVDINANQKLNDKIFMILVPGASPAEDLLFVDPSGTADFRTAQPIGDFNKTRAVVTSFAEAFGFELKADDLPKSDGSGKVTVRSASIVGFDPGNHGSHVAGIAAGVKTIANDPNDTLARGVAPAANILMNRVCANNGGCNATDAFIDLVVNGGAEVINMSLGGLNPFNDGYGVEETMINRLTSLKNVLFVISAGNSGPGRQTVGSPSVARFSLSVGASASKGMIQRQYEWPGMGSSIPNADADQDFMLFFSSRGPTAAGGFKPNVAAPGTELSAIQLNSAPGHRGGLDVYWGTSMAAPAATGAYALLIDGIKKYNLKHPDVPLTTNSIALRQVLIETARPFDVSSFKPDPGKPDTGTITEGKLTWIDEGAGMIDLVAAWNKLFEIRDKPISTAVRMGDVPVELDYQVIVPMTKAPNGIAYDGSRPSSQGVPPFGTGLYLDYAGKETLRQVFVARRLPEALASGPAAGNLTGQLLTTSDEFVLKTTIYGSSKNWLKAGVLDQLNCDFSGTSEARLTLIGRGVDIKVKEDGSGEVNPFNASVLNVCINREMLQNELPPGDHGAIISAYRKVNGAVSPLPSFQVPVYVTVPHKNLAGSSAYEVLETVNSFGVSRNYVTVLPGTSVVQVVLEVPALKPGDECSGVELMALEGSNTSKPFASRKEARVSNCDAMGIPIESAARRTLVFTRTNPSPGVWDLHVFGSYKYARSKFRLRVDYVTASASIAKIEGDLAALKGAFNWSVNESSMKVFPDPKTSKFELNGLFNAVQAKVAKGAFVVVQNPLGKFRSYPEGTQEVIITTGNSPGNDIDLTILECELPEKETDSIDCEAVAASGGATDIESASFQPKAGKVYAARVDGYNIKDEGKFTSGETIRFHAEPGSLLIVENQAAFTVNYEVSADQLASSKIASSELFTSGKYSIVGDLILKTAAGIVLTGIPVSVAIH